MSKKILKLGYPHYSINEYTVDQSSELLSNSVKKHFVFALLLAVPIKSNACSPDDFVVALSAALTPFAQPISNWTFKDFLKALFMLIKFVFVTNQNTPPIISPVIKALDYL